MHKTTEVYAKVAPFRVLTKPQFKTKSRKTTKTDNLFSKHVLGIRVQPSLRDWLFNTACYEVLTLANSELRAFMTSWCENLSWSLLIRA